MCEKTKMMKQANGCNLGALTASTQAAVVIQFGSDVTNWTTTDDELSYSRQANDRAHKASNAALVEDDERR